MSENLMGVVETPVVDVVTVVETSKTLILPSTIVQPEKKRDLSVEERAERERLERERTVPVDSAILERRFKHFPNFRAKAPKLALRTGGVRKVLGPDGKVVTTERFKKGFGYIQVCNIEVQRCARAIKGREGAIARAETALANVRKTAAGPSRVTLIEKAQERLEIAKIRRDLTVAKFNHMLNYAKDHNLKTLEKRKTENAKNPEKAAIIVAAADSLKHLDKVRTDFLLTAQVQAGGSQSHRAFEQLRDSYKWIVQNFSRPNSTPLEPEEAVTRGIEGLWDAARRFDPLRKGEKGGALFSTVAYNWVRRNTRARTNADVKPGQFKVSGETKSFVSIDGQVNEDGETQEFSLASVGSSEMSDSMKYDVAEALATLDVTQQTILKLRHFDNMSLDQISKLVNMPVGAVKQISSQAHRLLQERLSGYMN